MVKYLMLKRVVRLFFYGIVTHYLEYIVGLCQVAKFRFLYNGITTNNRLIKKNAEIIKLM